MLEADRLALCLLPGAESCLAGGGALADRELQSLGKLAVLLSRADMRHRGQPAKQILVQRVEDRQAGREQRAEDDALGDAFRDAATEPHRDLLERILNYAHRARGQHRDAVADEY